MSTEYQYDEELELYLNEDGDEFTEDEIEALEVQGLLNEDESKMDLEDQFENVMELADCYRDDIACGRK